MTYNEFIRLSNSEVYEFRFYYGEKKVGILTEEDSSGKVYLIPKYKINELNKPGKKPSEVGKLVNLACIVFWKIADQGQSDRQAEFFPLTNKPVIRKLIILGAGASYDAGILNENHRPPLANDLFNERYIGPIRFIKALFSFVQTSLIPKILKITFNKNGTELLHIMT